MASPAVALPNGVPTPMQLDTDADPAQSINSSTKRKRESSNVDEKQLPNGIAVNGINPTNSLAAITNNGSGTAAAATTTFSSSNKTKIDRSTVRDYFELLQSFDTTPSILKRPLPESTPSDEPDAKRQKSVDGTPFPSIADKVANDEYRDVEAIIIDLKTSVTEQLAELRQTEPGKDPKEADLAIASIIDFKQKAYGLFRREMTYPRPTHVPEVLRSLDSTNDLDSNASGNMVLTVFGDAPRPRQLYSSLQQPIAGGGKAGYQPLRETGLPTGMKAIKAVPYFFPSALEKDKKSKTLGELFPPPRNLPSLQPPKAPKSTTKGVQVGWHRPELTEKSKYRAGSYFSQTISTGRWLDYSNAAPPSQIMTKQRERALSLAGNKPSSSDIEMSEMEALFRGAFSSFAPSKDDSAAMISSGLISQTMWWQRAGQRSLDRLMEAELPEEPSNETDEPTDNNPVEQVDEDLIQKAIDNWDDSLVDPSLEEACCPKKSDEEKDVDDILQDVSDMIQTLISYQKNRNLTLPTASSQSRYAADPAHSDMLTNGTPVQPGEEETATYQALKAQLVLVIQMLPPYCVARLNSDKLDELNISTKLEIRTDEYQGVMEEDEAAARARAAQAAAASARPASHRSSSTSSNMQYSQQYHPAATRAPMPNQPYYGPQTPVRPPQPNLQRPPQTMPAAYPSRVPAGGYRPPSSYPTPSYPQSYAKPPASYAQQGAYPGTPTQTRPPYQPPHMQGYPTAMVSATPQARYPAYSHPPNTAAPSYHHQPYQPPHPQHGTPTHPAYGHYPNGAGGMPQRTASPHVHHQPPQHPHMPQPPYHPPPTPTRQPSYGGQPNMMNDPSRRYYSPAGQPPMQNHQGQPQPPHNTNQAPPNAAFHTSLNPHQVQQAMDQAKARFQAQRNAQQSNEGLRGPISNQGQGAGPGQGHVGAPVGLGGIGLGQDPNRMAVARANMPSGVNYSASSPSPKPQLNSPAMNAPPPGAVNGSPAMAPTGPAVANGNGGSPAAGNEA
ncbi:hypothetical protein F4810DRAFT_228298 [Camillea tinctor]|nr:hypothetical protein F4810DRAFT_228298 [Camillea tinctor]